jgi:hypothetical protein
MPQIRFIKSDLHGVLDYIVDITLIGAPFLLGFQDAGAAALWLPVAIGIVNFVYSLLTRYSRGLVPLVSFPQHLALDAVAGLTLIAVPLGVGMSGPSLWFAIVMGAGILGAVALTDPIVKEG